MKSWYGDLRLPKKVLNTDEKGVRIGIGPAIYVEDKRELIFGR